MAMLRERIHGLFNLRRGELAPVLVAGLFFFCILTALMMLRPARDALGMERGIESIRWLFLGTAVVTLLVNPVFGWLVSRCKRLHFIGATYGFFALSLVASARCWCSRRTRWARAAGRCSMSGSACSTCS